MAEFSSADRSSSPEARSGRLFGESETTSNEVAVTPVSPTSPTSDSSHILRTSATSPTSIRSQIESQPFSYATQVSQTDRRLEDVEEEVSSTRYWGYSEEDVRSSTSNLEYSEEDVTSSTLSLENDRPESTPSSYPISISELFEPVVCTNPESYFEIIRQALEAAPSLRAERTRNLAILSLIGVTVIDPHPSFYIMEPVASNEYATDLIRDHHFKLNEPSGFQEPMRSSPFLQFYSQYGLQKRDATRICTMGEGFQNAIFAESVRQNAAKPVMPPYWVTGTECGLAQWVATRMFFRMKTANEQIFQSVAYLSDERSLEEDFVICSGGLSNSASLPEQSQFYVRPGYGETIRNFVKEHSQFLIEVVLNNELHGKVSPIQFNSKGEAILMTFWDTHGCTEDVKVFTEKPELGTFPDGTPFIRAHGNMVFGSFNGKTTVTDPTENASSESTTEDAAEDATEETADDPNISEPRGKHYARNLRKRVNRKASRDQGASQSNDASSSGLVPNTSPSDVSEHTEDEEANTEAFPDIGDVDYDIESNYGDGNDERDPILQSISDMTTEREIHDRDRRDSINSIKSRTASRVSHSASQLQGTSSDTIANALGILHTEQFVATNDMGRIWARSGAAQGHTSDQTEDSNVFQQSADLQSPSVPSLSAVIEESGTEEAKPSSKESATPKKSGKWIAPLPEDQDWKTLDRVPGYGLVPGVAKNNNKNQNKNKNKKSKNKTGKTLGSSCAPQSGPFLNEKASFGEHYLSGTLASNSDEEDFEEKNISSSGPANQARACFLDSDAKASHENMPADAFSFANSQGGDEELENSDTQLALPDISIYIVSRSSSLRDSLVNAGVSASALQSLTSSNPIHPHISKPSLHATTSVDDDLSTVVTKDLIVNSEMALEWDIETIMNDRLQNPQDYPVHGPIFRSHNRSMSAQENGSSDGKEDMEDTNNEDEIQMLSQRRPQSAMGQFSSGSLQKPSTACGSIACLHCLAQASSSFTPDTPDIPALEGRDARQILGDHFPKALTLASHPKVNYLFKKYPLSKCAYCGDRVPDVWDDEPCMSVLCPGCGPCSTIRYCTTACLLADTLDHEKICGAKSGVFPMDWLNAPKRFHEMMPPIQPLDGKINAEWFRQRQYSMICHENVCRNPTEAFFDYRLSKEKQLQLAGRDNWAPSSGLEPADYFVFYPAPPEKIPDRVSFVVFQVTFPEQSNHKIKFNRALNAAFLTGDSDILTFVFDAAHSRIDDDKEFFYHIMDNVEQRGRPMTAAEKVLYIHTVLTVQFYKEFNFHAPVNTAAFDFDAAFSLIFAKVADLEFQHPILRAWWRGDPTKSADPWIRLKGSDWVAQLITHYPLEEWDRVDNLVKGDLSLFGPGYTGQDPAVWQKHLNNLHNFNVHAALRKIDILQ